MSADALTLRDIQARVDAWIQVNGGYWPELSMLARLTEETGEVAREYNHRFGAKRKKQSEGEAELALEMADVLFILVCMANQQGIDLDDALTRTLEKYRIRDAGRWTASS
jgi:NTP pyrophosphatase (non-canonical NTP hydrolase)